MHPTPKLLALACAAALGSLLALGDPGRADGPERIAPARSARGGALVKTSRYQFEVFCYTTGLRVFPGSAAGAPIDASRLTGTATFYHPNSPKPWFERPLHAAPAGPGQPSESLDLGIDLGTVPPTGVKVALRIGGLPDPALPTASFTVPFDLVRGPAGSISPETSTGSASSPRYYYGPGPFGYGYYPYASPEAAPVLGGSGAGFRGYAPHLGHRPSYDWSVGRDNPLAKPWLRPWD